jgi:uncharacterized phage-associated protein
MPFNNWRLFIMAVTALQLGSELVRRFAARGQSMTNLAAQKLAFFCHGWHLALNDAPLVDEEFEAWKLGPVLPSLYHTFKAFSSNPIPANHPIVQEQTPLDPGSPSSALVDQVLAAYAPFTSAQLVTLSHTSDGPWYQVWNDPSNPGTISNLAIQEYFARQARE